MLGSDLLRDFLKSLAHSFLILGTLPVLTTNHAAYTSVSIA